MAALDSTYGIQVSKFFCGIAATAPTTPMMLALGSTAPTASGAMTQLTSGSGYTTNGNTMGVIPTPSWTGTYIQTQPPAAAMTWTCGLGGGWTIVGAEIWDSTPHRWLFGTWNGQPISVAQSNGFQVAINGITLNLQ